MQSSFASQTVTFSTFISSASGTWIASYIWLIGLTEDDSLWLEAALCCEGGFLITCMYPFCPKSYQKNKKYTNTIPVTFGMEGMYRFPFAIRKIVAIHNIPELFFRWSRDFSTSSKLLPKGVSVRNQKYDLISSVAASQNGDFVLTFQAALSPEKKGLSRAKETLLWASLEKPS